MEFYIGLLLGSLILLCYAIYQIVKTKNKEKEKELIESQFLYKLTSIKEKMKSPLISSKYYLWLDNNSLNCFPVDYKTNPWEITSIDTDKILFYKQFGDLYTETTGSGGESSYSLITGFHGKINPINIKTEVRDNRSTQLFYDDGNEDKILVLGYEDFILLKRLIPDKDYAVVEAIRIADASQNAEKQIANNSIENRLLKLENLKNKNLISDEEYKEKRSKLMDEI